MNYNQKIPWADARRWEPDVWYPLPVGYHERDFGDDVWFVDGWQIFVQDPECPADILPPYDGPDLTFTQALAVCEAHNGRKFDGLKFVEGA